MSPVAHPLKVAFCLDSFAIGGTELNAVRTAEAFDPARVALTVYYLRGDGPLRSRYEKLGISMTHCPIASLYSPRTAFRGAWLASDLRRRGIQILHSHDIYSNIFAVPWARMAGGCATIASRRWLFEAPRPGLIPLNRWANRLASIIVGNSRAVSDLLQGVEGVEPGKIRYVPNFVDPHAFEIPPPDEISEQRRKWGLPNNAFVVGIVARLAPVKNHKMLIAAVSRMELVVHLVIVGDGALRTHLEKLAAQLGIASRVHFTGEVIGARNLNHFFDASVLCSTSEGFPNSLIEAMAAGTAVVATPVGGVNDVVEDGVNGLLVPVGDDVALSGALEQMRADVRLRLRLGSAGKAVAREKHHRDVAVRYLTSLYAELASSRGGRS